jgi:hypothetical protein
MAFSAVNFNLKEPLGPMKGAFTHLGYPSYFRIDLTVARALGILALVLPGVPRKASLRTSASASRWYPPASPIIPLATLRCS